MATLQEIMMLRNQPSPLAQLGQVVGDVYGTYKQKEKEQNALDKNEAAKLQAFTLLSQSEKAQDPAQREELFMQAYKASPQLVDGILNAQKTRREGMGGANKPEARTTAQKNYEQYAALKKSDPDSAIEFGKASGFIDNQGNELSVHLQKRLSESTDSAIDSRSNVAEFQDLASKIEGEEFSGGIFSGTWGEKIKDITGQQDATTMLRKKYNSVRASQVVKNLPPGAASDVDIALALSGFPSDNASGKELASFLRGVAKLEQRQADFEDFKADYISTNNSEKGMLKAYKESQNKEANNVLDWSSM